MCTVAQREVKMLIYKECDRLCNLLCIGFLAYGQSQTADRRLASPSGFIEYEYVTAVVTRSQILVLAWTLIFVVS